MLGINIFCPIYAYFLSNTLSSSLLSQRLTRKSHSKRYSSPPPTTVRAFVLFVGKWKFIIFKSPSLAPTCVELVCMEPTTHYNTRLRGFFWSRLLHWSYCLRLRSWPERIHTPYLSTRCLWCIFKWSIVSTPFDISQWYRYRDMQWKIDIDIDIPKIQHYRPRILYTIPNTRL